MQIGGADERREYVSRFGYYKNKSKKLKFRLCPSSASAIQSKPGMKFRKFLLVFCFVFVFGIVAR